MLTSLLLMSAVLPQQQVQTQFDETRARSYVSDLFRRMPLKEYRLELAESATNPSLMTVRGEGNDRRFENDYVSAAYWVSESAVFAISFSWPDMPFATSDVGVEQALEIARECAAAILPHFGNWETKMVVASEDYYLLRATPKIGSMFTRESVQVDVRRIDGLPLRVGRSMPMMDYSVFQGKKYITEDRALQIALQIYNSYKPYDSGVLDSVRLTLGAPTIPEYEPQALSREDLDYVSRNVAIPFYWVMISNARSSKMVQHMFVHAIDGRPLSISMASALGGGKPINVSLGNDAIKAQFGNDPKQFTLKPSLERKDSLDESTPVVSLTIGKAIYAVRVDAEHKFLWLKNGEQWWAYTVAESIFEKLVKLAVKPGTFGKTAYPAAKRRQ